MSEMLPLAISLWLGAAACSAVQLPPVKNLLKEGLLKYFISLVINFGNSSEFTCFSGVKGRLLGNCS